jgi:hypothetical protein
VPVPSSSYTATVTRGFYNKDGGTLADTCATVPYTVTLATVTLKKQGHFEWPVTGAGSDEEAAFKYKINLSPELTKVGWLPNTASPSFIDGPRCLPPPALAPTALGVLPAPFGELLADVDVNGYIEVDTVTGAVYARPAALTPVRHRDRSRAVDGLLRQHGRRCG